jgi:hypothetical protein
MTKADGYQGVPEGTRLKLTRTEWLRTGGGMLHAVGHDNLMGFGYYKTDPETGATEREGFIFGVHTDYWNSISDYWVRDRWLRSFAYNPADGRLYFMDVSQLCAVADPGSDNRLGYERVTRFGFGTGIKRYTENNNVLREYNDFYFDASGTAYLSLFDYPTGRTFVYSFVPITEEG